MSSVQVFTAQGCDGLPLEDDELVDILSLKRVEELDDVAVVSV